MYQLSSLGSVVTPQPGDRVLSILPSWHAYERTVEYFALSQGVTLIYTTNRYIKRDLEFFKPNYVVVVPRLLEFIYQSFEKQLGSQSARQQQLAKLLLAQSQRYIEARRVADGLSIIATSGLSTLMARAQMVLLKPVQMLADRLIFSPFRAVLGGQIKQLISGGGALAMNLETFYEMASVEIIEGYGLTETAPVLTARRSWHNLRGSAGKPLPGTELKIVDPETKEIVPLGQRGLVLVRGPQIMQGYYNNPEATAKAIDAEGWFNTEDLGWLTVQQDLVLTGRAKDTIVLTNGENIEPQPIEEACTRSPYIDQIVVVGQDQRSLGALIVPDLDAIQAWSASRQLDLQLPKFDPNDANASQSVEAPVWDSKPVYDLIRQELNREVKNRPGYSANDNIGAFYLLLEPFSIENGLMTQTLKIKRNVVLSRYNELIQRMFSNR